LLALAKIYSQEGEWEELVQIYSTLAETIRDPRISVEYNLAAGEIWEKRLAGPDLAILSYKNLYDYLYYHKIPILSSFLYLAFLVKYVSKLLIQICIFYFFI
jgi:hypothetical protein